MDKSIEINPESIKKSIETQFNILMTNPNLKHLKVQLAAMVVASGSFVQTARADAEINAADIKGMISYGRFKDFISQDLINQVTVS